MATLAQKREQEIQTASQRRAMSGRRDFGPYAWLSRITGLFLIGAAAHVIGAVASSVVAAAVAAPAALRTMVRKTTRGLDLAAAPKGPST